MLYLRLLDLLVGSTTMVSTVTTVSVDKWLLGSHWCSFSAFLDNVLLIGSLCTLAGLSPVVGCVVCRVYVTYVSCVCVVCVCVVCRVYVSCVVCVCRMRVSCACVSLLCV